MARKRTTDTLIEIKSDFRKFLFLVLQHINLPNPTRIQYDIAHYLQHGPRRCCIEAFRGVGKSLITSAYVLWVLLNDPQKKILVVSASKDRADNFTIMTMRLIKEMPMLRHLIPREGQRDSRVSFDVGPAVADQSPSVKSVGITSQITGSRADIIIADDVEVLNNSNTHEMRERLRERVKEFSAVIKPLEDTKIIYLGTPQTEESLYNQLPQTFSIRIWPALVPTKDEAEAYGDRLAPIVRKMMETREAGDPVDPERFDENDLAARMAEYGKAGFALQFMLNTQLSDLQKYPLKVRDLIVMDIAKDQAPMKLDWLPDVKRELKQLPNLGMAGDRFFGPAGHSDIFREFTGTVMSIDPSGRGKDETGYAIVKMLSGFLYVRKAGGMVGGYDTETLTKLAMLAKEEQVNHVVIEGNFGDGMYLQLFQPILNRIHPCAVEEVKHSIQKERRIIDTLEPVMARHRLVFDKEVIEEDYRTAHAYDGDHKFTRSLIYQMTHVCLDKGALKHDDRLDALAIAVNYWTGVMNQDADRNIKEEKDDALQKMLDQFMEDITGARPGRPNFSGLVGR